MEDKEESGSTTGNNKVTRLLVCAVMGANLGFLHYAYGFFLITSPFMRRMQRQNLEAEGYDRNSKLFKLLTLATVAIIPIGGLLGVLVWGYLADRYGRKSSLLISNGLSIFSSTILCFNKIFHRFELNLFAHFLGGFACGTLNHSVIIYILEISPLNLRGALVTTSILFYGWGHFLIQIVTVPDVLGNKENYSLLVGITALIAVTSTVLLLASPESPRFLYIQRNDEDKAREVLKKLRGEEDVEEEMEELCQEHFAEIHQKNMTVCKLLRFRSLRWHLITVAVIVIGSQFVEMNSMLNFAEQSYKVLGLSIKAMNLLPLVGSLIVQLMLLTTICMIESLGRRFLLLSGFLICCITNMILVFTLKVETAPVAFISIVLIIVFFLGYIAGPGSISVLIINELFLQSSRVSACVISGLISWGTNFISFILFLQLKRYLEAYFLLLYWPFMILTFIYIFRVVPETMGKTFQEIQENMAVWMSKDSRKTMAE